MTALQFRDSGLGRLLFRIQTGAQPLDWVFQLVIEASRSSYLDTMAISMARMSLFSDSAVEFERTERWSKVFVEKIVHAHPCIFCSILVVPLTRIIEEGVSRAVINLVGELFAILFHRLCNLRNMCRNAFVSFTVQAKDRACDIFQALHWGRAAVEYHRGHKQIGGRCEKKRSRPAPAKPHGGKVSAFHILLSIKIFQPCN